MECEEIFFITGIIVENNHTDYEYLTFKLHVMLKVNQQFHACIKRRIYVPSPSTMLPYDGGRAFMCDCNLSRNICIQSITYTGDLFTQWEILVPMEQVLIRLTYMLFRATCVTCMHANKV